MFDLLGLTIETKSTLKVVTDTMGAVERNEAVDINNLMNMVSGLKLDNLGKPYID